MESKDKAVERGRMVADAVTSGSLCLIAGGVAAPVIDLDLDESPNRHGRISAVIMVDEQMKEYILYEGVGSVSLLCLKDRAFQPLFQGIVSRMKAESAGDLYYMHIDAVTDSYLMDLSPYNMSFQDTAMTSHQLVRHLMGFYPNSQPLLSIPDQPMGRIAIQYQETSWEFLKRILSEFEDSIYVDSTSLGIRLKIGLQEMEEHVDWDKTPYTVRRSPAPRDTDKQLKDQLVYQVTAYDILPLGGKVSFHDRDLYIGAIHRSLEDGLLTSRYSLYFKEGLRTRTYHNPLLSGVSIRGTVMDVRRNQVRAKLETDCSETSQSQYYYPFSTVAASPDGSGWYCMPKAGDPVRIFFPTSNEGDGYAIASMQGESSPEPNSPMGNPDLKDVTTPDGKSVKFIAGGILLTVGGGKGSVTLANGKAEIRSDEDIAIGAEEEIKLQAEGEIKMISGVKIDITSDQGGSLHITEDTVEVEAAVIKNNC